MAFDEFLADRMRRVFNDKSIPFEEKKMMGGLGIMMDDKLCIGIFKNELMARVGPHDIDTLLERPHCRQMQNGERIMKGYISVEPDGYDLDSDLEFWIEACIKFNPEAKSSKKR